MANNEAIRRLDTLSQRERQVLGLVCSGIMQKDIAKTLFISIPTVKQDMGRVYVKLGLDQLNSAERRKAIYEIYCPLLKSSPLPQQPLPPEQEFPVPSAIIKMVDEDELAVIPYNPTTPATFTAQQYPKEVIYIPSPKKEPARSNVLLWVVIIILAAGLIYVGSQLSNRPSTPQVITQVVVATSGITPESTAIPTFTLAPVMPTYTPIVKEVTVVVTNSPQPTAVIQPPSTVSSIAMPFSDNFENGANSSWQVANGDWLTANGRYSITNTDINWRFTFLNDPNWKNYQVKVNITRSHPGALVEGEEAIFVRYVATESKYLVFYLNSLDQAGWAFYDGSSYLPFISGHKSFDATIPNNIEIDVTGNQFMAKINGMNAQQISISGYGNGGVGLGTRCASSPCSSFDNFQVNALP